jgi:hypothetical protein
LADPQLFSETHRQSLNSLVSTKSPGWIYKWGTKTETMRSLRM